MRFSRGPGSSRAARFVLVAAVACGGSWSIAAQELPRRADLLRVPSHTSNLSESQLDGLVTRWLSQVDPSDPSRAIAAIEIVDGAPSAFVERPASKVARQRSF